MTWYFRSAVLAGLVVVLLAGVPTTVVDAATTVLPTKTSTTTERLSDQMAPPTGYSASQMIFDDQFSGTSLNSSNWSPQLGDEDSTWDDGGKIAAPFSGPSTPVTKEEAMFGPSQVSVDNGLTLTATRNTNSYSSTYPWISGVVTTDGKFTLPTAGWYVQVRAKMPNQSQGMWPAIWFLCGTKCSDNNEFDGYEGGWPGFEPDEIMHSVYFADQGQQGGQPYDVGSDVTSGYNTYGFQFVPGQSITVYFNGKQVWQLLASSGITIAGEPYEIILSLQVASAKTSSWHTVTSSRWVVSSRDYAPMTN